MSNQNIVPTTKEIEAKFFVEPEEIRKKLVSLNAELIEKEKPMRRKVFGIAHDNKYFRVRDENSSITMTCKVITGKGIHDVLETEIKVDNFDKACEILELTGLPVKSYQETTREIWELDDVEIVIDHWPFLPYVVEVEGESEELVKSVCKKLGFDFDKAVFGGIGGMYILVYDVEEKEVNSWENITFENKELEKYLLGKKR